MFIQKIIILFTNLSTSKLIVTEKMNSINFRTKAREKRAAWYTSVRSSTIKLWIHGNKVAKLFCTLNLLLFRRSRCRRRRSFVLSLDDYYFLLLKVRYKLDRISIVHDRALIEG